MKKVLTIVLALVLCVSLTVPAFAAPVEGESAATHKVAPGENLSKLAVMYYGDRFQWKKIYEANKDIIKDPNLIFVGQELVIPDAAPVEMSYRMGQNDPAGSVVISGDNVGYLEYNPTGNWLYFANPYFLDDFFVGIGTEGTAWLEGDVITVSFTRNDDHNSGAVAGAKITFEVNLTRYTAAMTQIEPYEDKTIELSKDRMVKIGAKLAEVMRAAEQYRQQNGND